MYRSIIGRAAGIILTDGLVLLQRNGADAFWAVPGGRIETGESSEQALLREIKEEMNWKPPDSKFICNAHEVFEIYAIDYSALSGDFWGMPCEAVVFAERLNFKLAVIFPKFINVTVHFVVNKGAPLQIQQS